MTMIQNLPRGISYILDDTNPDTFTSNDASETESQDVMRIGNFAVNINIVSKESIKAMRTYLPREQYKLLKNRKTARLCRQKRAFERTARLTEMKHVLAENGQFKDRIETLKRELNAKKDEIERLKVSYLGTRMAERFANEPNEKRFKC